MAKKQKKAEKAPVAKPKHEYSTIDELAEIVKKLDKKFKLVKVNIVHPEGGNEGIWAVAADEDSARRYNDNTSSGEEVFVRLCNRPLLENFYWGSLILATTQGSDRPRVKFPQIHPRVLADQKLLNPLMEKAIVEAAGDEATKQAKTKKLPANEWWREAQHLNEEGDGQVFTRTYTRTGEVWTVKLTDGEGGFISASVVKDGKQRTIKGPYSGE